MFFWFKATLILFDKSWGERKGEGGKLFLKD